VGLSPAKKPDAVTFSPAPFWVMSPYPMINSLFCRTCRSICFVAESLRSIDQVPVRFASEDNAPTLSVAPELKPTVIGGTIPVPVVIVPIYPCEDTCDTRQIKNDAISSVLFIFMSQAFPLSDARCIECI